VGRSAATPSFIRPASSRSQRWRTRSSYIPGRVTVADLKTDDSVKRAGLPLELMIVRHIGETALRRDGLTSGHAGGSTGGVLAPEPRRVTDPCASGVR
jgi:hypothetical protein